MKDLEAAKHCLGIRIERTADEIGLDQQTYIDSVMKRLNMINLSEKLSNEMSSKTT